MNTSPHWPRSFEVASDKIGLHLLNPAHPVGGAKAKFFLGWGFDRSRESEFADAILAHTRTATVTKITQTRFGDVIVFEGPLVSPKGVTPPVRSVWQRDFGTGLARLLTTYPCSAPGSTPP